MVGQRQAHRTPKAFRCARSKNALRVASDAALAPALRDSQRNRPLPPNPAFPKFPSAFIRVHRRPKNPPPRYGAARVTERAESPILSPTVTGYFSPPSPIPSTTCQLQILRALLAASTLGMGEKWGQTSPSQDAQAVILSRQPLVDRAVCPHFATQLK
jgi:hypothetical protein